jgi:hypothetical protein
VHVHRIDVSAYVCMDVWMDIVISVSINVPKERMLQGLGWRGAACGIKLHELLHQLQKLNKTHD